LVGGGNDVKKKKRAFKRGKRRDASITQKLLITLDNVRKTNKTKREVSSRRETTP